jgi:AmmeMemoRadiSam system protein A
MDPLVQLARSAIESLVLGGKIPQSHVDAVPPEKAGVFVSIHNARGVLRGCIGTIMPVCNTMAEEIIRNARSVCSQDFRFMPVQPDEVADLTVKVDVLSIPEPVENKSQLDSDKYGLIVSTADGRRALLLPALEGVETVVDQIDICRKKGNIRPNEPITMQRFTVERHE